MSICTCRKIQSDRRKQLRTCRSCGHISILIDGSTLINYMYMIIIIIIVRMPFDLSLVVQTYESWRE